MLKALFPMGHSVPLCVGPELLMVSQRRQGRRATFQNKSRPGLGYPLVSGYLNLTLVSNPVLDVIAYVIPSY